MYAFLYKREPLQRKPFSKSLSKTYLINTSLNYFRNKHFVYVLIETRIITKLHFQNTFKNHTKHDFKQKQVIKQVTKSPWKTMDEKGANTFPFHNLPKSWLFDFLMNKFHILTCFNELRSLALEFDQKVKVLLFSIQLTLDQLTAKFICQSNGIAMF